MFTEKEVIEKFATEKTGQNSPFHVKNVNKNYYVKTREKGRKEIYPFSVPKDWVEDENEAIQYVLKRLNPYWEVVK